MLHCHSSAGAAPKLESTPENSALGFGGAKILPMPPYVMKQLHNTN